MDLTPLNKKISQLLITFTAITKTIKENNKKRLPFDHYFSNFVKKIRKYATSI